MTYRERVVSAVASERVCRKVAVLFGVSVVTAMVAMKVMMLRSKSMATRRQSLKRQSMHSMM